MLRLDVLLVIIGMAIVTFACRAGGYAVLRVVRPSPFVDAMLRNIPGPLFAAYVALALSNMGPAAWVAAALVVLTQWKSGSVGLSILVGVGAVALLRPVLG
ncbi:AzlD family protein [Roseomonas marmotae]|uniref:AzlD domain-containing protein n=1 Tax=Roseomonas marmotae TaxID=2768161 RepID=A0ABS3KC97_9PROT|nr:AzlD domain-containing protein [Roseomonas marmotae]MBO1075099.1 AzlD domain-containing protein [Roseomonas marmotae]QTI79786.1 AzlD domain-containing protein [Roseomonas marmotae]